jgi:hypothetical protein
MINVRPSNILANHPSYPKIFATYNELLKTGKVNNKKFWEEVIVPEIPNYSMMSWYQFLRRFKTEYGLAPSTTSTPMTSLSGDIEMEVAKTMTSNQESTAQMVQHILFLASESSKRMTEHPELATDQDRKNVELGIKIMKAQDSRIHAIGKIKEDSREEEKLQRLFDNATY